MARKRELERIVGHRVRLPEGVRSPFEVYRNGVLQELGRDYRVTNSELVFKAELVREKLSTGAWFLGAWGIGTYKRNDEVDVRYEVHGRPTVAQGLEFIPD
jgi:hypothetical protein